TAARRTRPPGSPTTAGAEDGPARQGRRDRRPQDEEDDLPDRVRVALGKQRASSIVRTSVPGRRLAPASPWRVLPRSRSAPWGGAPPGPPASAPSARCRACLSAP